MSIRFHLRVPHCLCQSRSVRLIVRRDVHLPVGDAVLFQTARLLTGDADNTQQGIIGCTDRRDQHIARPQCAVQCGGDGVGAVDKLDADQGVLRPENLRVDGIQHVPALVIVAIAGGPGKNGLGHPVLLEGGQHFLAVVLRHFVNMGKLGRNLSLRLLCQRQHTGGYAQWICHVHGLISSLSQNA